MTQRISKKNWQKSPAKLPKNVIARKAKSKKPKVVSRAKAESVKNG